MRRDSSRKSIRKKVKYRLLTEAEWEYACRSGSTTAFANGGITRLQCDRDDNLDSIGWYFGNSNNMIQPVARKKPNAWGLYDMLGNVQEWCQDWFGGYPDDEVVNPKGPKGGLLPGDARRRLAQPGP